jgi:pimeloyl-ACP methyl ester carboxylesterase
MSILGGHRRCVAYTQRFFGPSSWRPGGRAFGTTTLAADLVRIVSALNLAPVELVAWSYGAHVALQALRERPDLFRHAVLYEPGFATFVEDEVLLRDYWQDAAAMFEPVEQHVAAGLLHEAVRLLIDGSGGAGYFDLQSARRRRIQLDSAAVLPFLMGGGAMPGPLQAADLRSVERPVTLVWGR